MPGAWLRAFARAAARRPALVLGLALASAGLAVLPARHLGIRSDVAALLPDDAPASDAYRRFLTTFGGIERVFVVARLPEGAPADPERLADAAEALAGALARSPEVAHARYGLDDEDERFFVDTLAPRLPLLLGSRPEEALAPHVTDAALAARVEAIRDEASGPAAIFFSRLTAADPLGLADDLLRALASGGALPFDPLTGAILSKDGRAALVIVTPKRGEADPKGGRALEDALQAAYAEVRAGAGGDLRFEAVGGPLYAVHDQDALQADLIKIVGVASLLVILLIVLAFDGPSIPAISIATVAVGQIWCAALVASVYGSVTAIGVGFAAILLGLGDDFTVHLGARVREEWLAGAGGSDAVEEAIASTGAGIVAAALTTAAAFACLAFAHFKPLRELGGVVAAGVLLLLAATAFVAAPLLTLAARRWKRRDDRPPWRGFGAIVERAIRLGEKAPRAILVAAAVATLLAIAGIARLRLDPDLRRMRPENHPAVRAERDLVSSFALPIDTATVMVPARTLDEALDRAEEVAGLLRASLPPGREVGSPSDWIVTGARLTRRLRSLAPLRLGDAADRLARALDARGLRPDAFAPALDGMRAIGRGEAPPALPLESWPDWLAEGVRAGPAGAAVAVRARLPEGAWPAGPPQETLAAIERVAPGAQVASAPRLGAELRALAVSDLERLGTLAVAVVLGIVLLSYRGDVRAAALTFAPVVLGIVWTAGLWGLLGRSLDVFSLCVFPVMVGIGIDDGLHVLHLARRRGDLSSATREAGRGVVLSNLTTCAGFAALGVSQVPALRNGGWIVCTGNLLCLIATLTVLPAWAALRSRVPRA